MMRVSVSMTPERETCTPLGSTESKRSSRKLLIAPEGAPDRKKELEKTGRVDI